MKVDESEMTRRGEFANVALLKSKDNPQKAILTLVKMAQGNQVLCNLLLLDGAKQIIRDYYHSQRQAAMTIALGRGSKILEQGSDASSNKSSISNKSSVRIARFEFWKAYTLFGSYEPIENANREMLILSAEKREKMAQENVTLANFERAVAKALPNDKAIVKKSMSLKDIEKIARKFKVSEKE